MIIQSDRCKKYFELDPVKKNNNSYSSNRINNSYTACGKKGCKVLIFVARPDMQLLGMFVKDKFSV